MNPKLIATLKAGVLFFIVSHPMLYTLVDKLFGKFLELLNPRYVQLLRIAESGRPTTFGLFIHSCVFMAIVYWMMKH